MKEREKERKKEKKRNLRHGELDTRCSLLHRCFGNPCRNRCNPENILFCSLVDSSLHSDYRSHSRIHPCNNPRNVQKYEMNS